MGSFEESVHHGFTAWEMAQEEKEFLEDHGCLKCENYSNPEFRVCDRCVWEKSKE